MSSGIEEASDSFVSGVMCCLSTAAAHGFLISITLFNMYSASSGAFLKYQESSSATNF